MERRGSAMGMADDTNHSGKEAYCAGSSNIFIVHSSEFKAVVGDAPLLVKVVAIDAHEGPVYIPEEDALYFTTLPQPGGTASGEPAALCGHYPRLPRWDQG